MNLHPVGLDGSGVLTIGRDDPRPWRLTVDVQTPGVVTLILTECTHGQCSTCAFRCEGDSRLREVAIDAVFGRDGLVSRAKALANWLDVHFSEHVGPAILRRLRQDV